MRLSVGLTEQQAWSRWAWLTNTVQLDIVPHRDLTYHNSCKGYRETIAAEISQPAHIYISGNEDKLGLYFEQT